MVDTTGQDAVGAPVSAIVVKVAVLVIEHDRQWPRRKAPPPGRSAPETCQAGPR